MVDEKKIRELGVTLVELSKATYIDYVGISNCAMNLLKIVFGEDYCFEIDVRKIATELGMMIVEQPLDRFSPREEKDIEERYIGKLFKRISMVTREKECILLLDTEVFPENMIRCTIAKMIGHCLMNYDKDNIIKDKQKVPIEFDEMEDVVANIFARFLLIPSSLVFQEFEEYFKNGYKKEKREDSWYKYLSIVAFVPIYEATIAWQETRLIRVLNPQK